MESDTTEQLYKESFKPIFDFTSTTYIDHMWFVGGPGVDWMAVLYRDTPDAVWRLTCRFRYHHSEEAFDGKDRKRVYEMTAPTGEGDKLRQVTEDIAITLQQKMGAEADLTSLSIQGNSETFIHILSKQSFAHVKVIEKESGTIQ